MKQFSNMTEPCMSQYDPDYLDAMRELNEMLGHEEPIVNRFYGIPSCSSSFEYIEGFGTLIHK